MHGAEVAELIKQAPDVCPITGYKKCVMYIIGGNVVYLPNPAYYAYTYPEYDEETKSFSHTRYDMDDDNSEEYLHLCDLEDIQNHPKLDDIKRIFNLQ